MAEELGFGMIVPKIEGMTNIVLNTSEYSKEITMKLTPIGAIVGKNPPYNRFNIPEGAKFILYNPASMEMAFEVGEVKEFPDNYQYKDEKTGKYVKVVFSRREIKSKNLGKFEGVPVK